MKTDLLSNTIVEAIQDKKGSSISVIDLSSIPTAPAFTFIICQGKTPAQTTAIAENVIDKAREMAARKPDSVNGIRNGQWIIVDFGDVMVHIFTPDFREFYNLEDLWSDGFIERIPDLD